MKRGEDLRNMAEESPGDQQWLQDPQVLRRPQTKDLGAVWLQQLPHPEPAIGASVPSPLVLKVHLTFLKQFLSSFLSRGWGS